MKTLEQIKNEYAVSNGYDNLNQLIAQIILSNSLNNAIEKIDYITEKISIESQKECLKRASENVDINSDSFLDDIKEIRIRESITNENNIIE